MPRDNYEIAKQNARQYFLTFDRGEAEKRPFLSCDEEYCYTMLCRQNCRISRSTGLVELQQPDGSWQEAAFNAAMTVYDLLCYSKPEARPSGEYVSMAQLNNVFTSGDNSGFYTVHAAWYDTHQDALAKACLALGGLPAKAPGDLAYVMPLTDFLSVVLQFWESDDEFPASITLLNDSHILDFMHFETVWYALGHLMDYLLQTAEGIAGQPH